jgi:hypothetical protein
MRLLVRSPGVTGAALGAGTRGACAVPLDVIELAWIAIARIAAMSNATRAAAAGLGFLRALVS